MSENMELLEQRVHKLRQRLDQASTVVELTQSRRDAAAQVSEEADREQRRIKSALKLAEKRAKRLSREAKHARKLADAAGQDLADAENELSDDLQSRQKRQDKVAKAEAALAAAKATADVEQAAEINKAEPRKRSAATTPPRRSPAPKKTAAKKTATKKTATKKTATKRAPAKRTATR